MIPTFGARQLVWLDVTAAEEAYVMALANRTVDDAYNEAVREFDNAEDRAQAALEYAHEAFKMMRSQEKDAGDDAPP